MNPFKSAFKGTNKLLGATIGLAVGAVSGLISGVIQGFFGSGPSNNTERTLYWVSNDYRRASNEWSLINAVFDGVVNCISGAIDGAKKGLDVGLTGLVKNPLDNFGEIVFGKFEQDPAIAAFVNRQQNQNQEPGPTFPSVSQKPVSMHFMSRPESNYTASASQSQAKNASPSYSGSTDAPPPPYRPHSR